MKLKPNRVLELLEKSIDGSITKKDIFELENAFPGLTQGYNLDNNTDFNSLRAELKKRAEKVNPHMIENLKKFLA